MKIFCLANRAKKFLTEGNFSYSYGSGYSDYRERCVFSLDGILNYFSNPSFKKRSKLIDAKIYLPKSNDEFEDCYSRTVQVAAEEFGFNVWKNSYDANFYKNFYNLNQKRFFEIWDNRPQIIRKNIPGMGNGDALAALTIFTGYRIPVGIPGKYHKYMSIHKAVDFLTLLRNGCKTFNI